MTERLEPSGADDAPEVRRWLKSAGASQEELLQFLLQVAKQIQAYHLQGRLYGSIEWEQITRSDVDASWTLVPPPDTLELGRFASEAPWYPKLSSHGIDVLPSGIYPAQAMVDQLGVALKVEALDCFALGALACRVLADCSVADYLASPKAFARVSPSARPFIDAALGFDRSRRAESVAQLIELLDTSLHGSADVPTSAARPTVASQHSATEDWAVETDIPFATIGHFRLIRRIGHGGMGDVYEGFDDSLQRRVALKVLPAELGRQESFVQRFYSEAASVAKIVHPNIVQIFFIGHDHGHHYFAMEYVDGESLAGRLAAERRLSIAESVKIADQVLKGLVAAHAKGLVHRDVKPGNILIEERTHRCLLADFGLVKSVWDDDGPTHSGMVLGTMDYVSPEQGRGQTVDGRSDLYSLGVVLYELISGKLPFFADSPTGMIFQHVYERPVPLHEALPHIPLEISAIVAKLMAKNPAQRYPDAASVLADLAAFSDGLPLPSGADKALSDDPDRFARTTREAIAAEPASVIIRAPEFDDLDLELEVLKRSPATLWGKWLELWYNWLEAKSPAIAERLQSTQLQIDRAIQKLERHRDQLQMLDRDARVILKQLQQQAAVLEHAGVPLSETHTQATLAELQNAVAEQQQQVDEIHARLNKVSAQLAQVRTERDVLVARLRAAQAKRQLHVDGRPTSAKRWPILGVAGLLVLILLGWRYSPWSSMRTASLDTAAVSTGGASAPIFRKWPVTEELETIIPLDANVKAMTVRTSNYNGQANYTLLASLENDAVFRFTYRKQLDSVYEIPLGAAPLDVHAVALSPAGRYAAFALGDRSIRVFKAEAEANEEYRRLEGHLLPASALQFSADESTLVSASNDQTLRFWDLQSGSEQRRFEFPQVSSPMMAANAALSRFLLGGTHKGGKMPARVWDVVGQHQAAAFPLDTATSSVALSRDAETAYCFAAGRIYAWNATTGEKLREFAPQSFTGAIAGAAGRAVTLTDGQMQLWDIESGKLIEASDVAIQPNRQTRIVLADSGEAAFVATNDKRLHILNLPKLPPPEGLLHTFRETSAIHALDISADGVWAAGGGDGKIFVWNLNLPGASFTLEASSPVTAVRFSPHIDYLAYGTGQKDSKINYVGVRELTSDHVERFVNKKNDWRKLSQFQKPITDLAWDSRGTRLFASSKDGSLAIWEPASDIVQAELHLPEPIQGFVNDEDAQTTLLISGLHSLAAWRWGVTELSNDFAPLEASKLAMSTANEWLALADGQGQITVFDSRSREPIASLPTESEPVTGLTFIPATKRLVAAYASGLIRVWDIKRSHVNKQFPSQGSAITALEVSPNGRYAIAASLDGTVNVWQLP